MTIIEIHNKTYLVPEKWNELSQKQLLGIMECLFIQQYTGEQALLRLLKILCNMSYFDFFRAQVAELEEFIYLTQFLLAEKTQLTKQLVPKWGDLYGPSDCLGNLLMGELVFCEDYFIKWCENKEDVVNLHEFIAVLYRPAKRKYDHAVNPDGDPREEFNPNTCSWRAKNVISKWPLNVKLSIATWFDASRLDIVESNPEVFGGEGGEPARYGLISVIRRVAKNNVLGDFNKVQEQFVSLVMIELNESIAESKEIERQMKSTA